MRIATAVSLCLLAIEAAAQQVIPQQPSVTAVPAQVRREAATIRDGGSAAENVVWVYEERFRLLHACALSRADGRIECWSKSLNQSEPSR